MLSIALAAAMPVVVFLRWNATTHKLSVAALRSDGGLEYDADLLAMASPDPDTGTAALHVIKDRSGPAPLTSTIEWPNTRFTSGPASSGLTDSTALIDDGHDEA
ncbi:hypothetical protein ABZ746_35970 [Streptomyces sp. NPDC020096]